MTEAPARVLVIGSGYGASVHAPAAAGSAGVKWVGLAPARPGSTLRLPVGMDGVHLVADWRAALGECDAVIVATPPLHQVAMAEEILAAGRPVLLEKPGGLAADALRGLVRPGRPRIAVGYNFRYVRGLEQLIALVRDGAIGAVRRVSVDWLTAGWGSPDRLWTWRCDQAAGGGVLRDVAAHALDYCALLHPGAVAHVTARLGRTFEHRRDGEGNPCPVTVPDRMDAILEKDDGASVRLSVANALPHGTGHRVTVVGTEGVAEWNHDAPFAPGAETLSVTRHGLPVPLALPDDDMSAGADSRIPAGRRLVDAFLGAADLPPFATVEDAARTLDLIARLEAAAQGECG